MANPTYLSLEEVARKYDVKKKVLTQLIEAGMIETRQSPTGELLVAVEKNGNGHRPRTKDEIITEKFSHLRGQPIKVTEAALQYDLNRRTILRWKDSGYISEVDPGSYPIRLDEADVAYCAYIYNQRQSGDGVVVGSRLFDEAGNPYQIKYPDLAEKRRKQ